MLSKSEFIAAALKQYVVVLDDGHGMQTIGKRTPIFPAGSGMKSETGNFMHENEFNRAVVKYAKDHLERCGIKVIESAAGDGDVPLATRSWIARNAKADVFVSVHANANNGKWNSAKGVETYYQTGAGSDSIKLANIMQKHLLMGTKQSSRGVKSNSYQVLRETHEHMASVLIECGFMDNLEEAKLLIDDNYRRETGKEVAQAICEYLGVTFIENTAVGGISTSKKEEEASKYPPATVVVEKENGSLRPLSTPGFINKGTSYVPVKAVSIVAGKSVGFDNKTKKASINEVVLDNTIVENGVAYAPSRDVAAAIGMIAQWSQSISQVKFVFGE
ncbi:N-acetylmuramoyl-L-alanine amidase [Paenibacillus sp. TCA20]|uniref:N-acetylmuramoyl-L-alanine amidase n=1 Tax=Paenibacillus urinalis TaxID=521520 RepID=A0ABY7XH05_9BACL|nr:MULTISPECIES: N-acetylmuramoyl-L-alanine amidase [Paenibacillus]WDI05045.1 N-acetylmuramoyl-L-alanine amidase [Paenibacillus urinalis]GAK42129.1 N-acetylmuramoyl-L-alanine amidase [Paenibacillus sp. TCA20]